MKKTLSFIPLYILLIFACVHIRQVQAESLDQKVQVKLNPIETSVENGTVTMSANLRVENPFDFDLQDVVAYVEEAIGLEIAPTSINIGDIEAGGSILTEQIVTLSYPEPSQDAANPKHQLKWSVDYTAPEVVGEGLALDAQDKAHKNKEKKQRNLSGLRLNEIMFYPKKAEPEWIELYNGSEQDVDIVGYEISNSKDTVYKIPETLSPVPAGAFVLVVFDGKDSTEDDSSFEEDSLAILHATRQNVFADDSDSCMIFSGRPHSKKTMQAFAAWGDAEDLKASVKKFAQHAVKKGLRSKHAGMVYTDREPRIEGPVPIAEEGGSLVLEINKNKHDGFTEVPVRRSEVTPGRPNPLPVPQLHLPHTALHTSADLFTFSWVAIEGALYQIQIARDPEFKEIVVNAKKLKKPRFRPTSRLTRNVMLYWRVRAVDEGKESGWSETRTFISDSPDTTSIEGSPTTLKEGLPNPLGVESRPARKDSSLLCVDGCDEAHWDKSNATGSQHDHSTWYCWAAAAQMLNWYRGGSLLQDEIVATVKGDITTGTAQPSPDIPHGITPENSLPHESHAGASREDGYHSLRYALQATNTELHVIDDEKPEADELRGFIDSGRPLRYSTGGHAMVVDGYRTTAAGVFQARFLNTDNDGQAEWRTWSTEPFAWCAVPDADLTGRSGDLRMTADNDGDGMVDFDEDERFPTDAKYKDSEWDGVRDKEDVASYALRGITADVDGDGIRGEVDPDSDNGGVLDGQEDLDWDGKYEVADGETDPHDPADETEIDIDLVLLIDTTSSMGDDIDAVKTAAEKIVDAIDDGTGSYRIAVMSFEDFPESPYGDADCGDYMYHDVLNFSSTKADIVNAINSLTLRCGADWPESHYSALMHSLEKDALGGWRDGVGKVVIFMSDAPPHSPEPNTGYVAADVVQASIDLDPAIIYPILIGDDPTAEAYYESLASGTGGKVFKATDASEVVDAIIESIETVVNAPIAIPGGPYSACEGAEILFDASASYDPDGTIVLYQWDFEDDGVYDAETAEPTVRYTYPFDYAGTARLRVQDNDFLFNTNLGVTSVKVGDDTAPIAVTQNITVQLDANGNATIAASDIDNGSEDNCGIAFMTVSPSNFTCSDIGANPVILTVTDNDGNSATATATVTVEDNIAPTAVTKDITVQLDADGNVAIAAADIDNGSYDNCGIASVSVSPSSFTCADIGANTVILTVTDNNGNSSAATATVTVEDNIAPTIDTNAPETIVPPDAPVSFTATATDNCSVAILEITDSYCYGIKGNSKKHSKMQSCIVNFSDDTLNIVDSGGVGDNITWTITASDQSGNTTTTEGHVLVKKPRKSKK